ncbi:AhpD-like protein [Irpex rosettiformis]|uniref:AhpD-like protein n=1 Tax=Irpex rosettiformis TaxID=378272 RepID=A0ACB8UCY2_9APHY|nr:AhpD-like protein [Irpex rosettiformis]
MPRVPYQFPEPGSSEVADAIRARRKDGELIQLDGVLLHAPTLAAGYSSLLRSVRLENSLPADIRELLILRVAVLNHAAYEWIAHEPLARSAGVTQVQLDTVRNENTALGDTVDPAGVFSEATRVALAYTDWMTKNIHVPQAVFNAVKTHFSDQQVVEITVTISTYNMVSRILVALDVGDKADTEIPQQEGI